MHTDTDKGPQTTPDTEDGAPQWIQDAAFECARLIDRLADEQKLVLNAEAQRDRLAEALRRIANIRMHPDGDVVGLKQSIARQALKDIVGEKGA